MESAETAFPARRSLVGIFKSIFDLIFFFSGEPLSHIARVAEGKSHIVANNSAGEAVYAGGAKEEMPKL